VDGLKVTCGLTAYTPGSAPGPTLGNKYGKTLSFPLLGQCLNVAYRRDAADKAVLPLQRVVDAGEYLGRFHVGGLLGETHSSGEVNQRRVGVASFHVLVVTAFQPTTM